MLKNILLLSFLFVSPISFAETGVISTQSSNSFDETLSAAESFIKSKGLTLFIKVDHAQNAKKAGLNLKPNTVLIFGNPKVGTPIMSQAASFGIDLPVKLHIYENKSGQIMVAYNKPVHLAEKHKANKKLMPIKKMTGLLGAMVRTITKN